MTLLHACAPLGICQASSDCSHPSCFQARLEGHGPQHEGTICKEAEACASHLGHMTYSLSSWAARHLTDGHISVLAIGPGPWGTRAAGAAHPPGPRPRGLVIATITCPVTCSMNGS